MTRSVEPDEEIWGTREELLLAGAVGRHGAENWDSVAMELQKRSPPAAALLTAQSCERRFLFLQRRFLKNGAAQSDVLFLLEELRKLRVAELRREVERYDVSILSLQLKVNELTAGRDRSVFDGGVPDPAGATPEEKNGDGERSSNESNSPGQKPGGEGSYNGSSDTVARCAEAATPAPPPSLPRAGGDDSGESMAESRGEEDASEPGVVSQPWASFFETLRSGDLGSHFERRHQTQETAEYASLIRQHMDLAMVRRKMAEGFYVADSEFYRDMMLLCTNAVVFFPRDSPEHRAALRLRRIVLERARAAGSNLQTGSASVTEDGPSPAAPPVTTAEPEETPAEKTGNSVREEVEEEEVNDESDEEEKMERNRAKERATVAVVRRTRTGKGRRKAAKKKSPPAAPPPDEDNSSSGSGKSDTKSGAAAAIIAAPAAKKRSAVNFLSRINGGAKEEETLKPAGKGKDPSTPLKRGVGRPPKRPPPPPPPPAAARRGRPAEADPAKKKRRRR